MTDLFLKNKNKKSFDFTNTSDSLNISNILNNKQKNNLKKNSSTSFIGDSINKFNNYSATSVVGGTNANLNNYSNTSSSNLSKINSKDINNLLSMLTSESNINVDTNTEVLENKLVNLLNKDSQNGGSNSENYDTEVLENKIKSIINQSQTAGSGINKSIFTAAALGLGAIAIYNHNKSKSDPTSSDNLISQVFAPSPNSTKLKTVQENNSSDQRVVDATTTDVDNSRNINNQINEEEIKQEQEQERLQQLQQQIEQKDLQIQQNKNEVIKTIANIEQQQAELEQQQAELKELKEQKQDLVGGKLGKGMLVFGEISKLVSNKLGIPNGPGAKKIAGQLQRDVKEKNPSIAVEKLLSTAKDHLEKNLSKYQKMAK